ncbi:MAG: RsmB/NOP family class I SAM-dependent RNA methyltransferase [Alicyclobacillus herbarius]|uniref:methyltransferase RsmF C-terminal domain-like protein n=1 Tax=Alicyclobacillus herbarius TaxID=122960 RepID=UPI002357399B|nr:RsmF rRNA methyltransferase first C-terminal domain-containing protein [Alicyclobacillus herbarius]MCL6631024.1 RsmB/NOP family class I SAM-dependent RNA methyltransferase [Alicyclobacillus herbarius]
MQGLPRAFEQRMKPLLGEEWSDFRDALEHPPVRAVRVARRPGEAAGLGDGSVHKGLANEGPIHDRRGAALLGSLSERVPWREDARLLPADSTLGRSVWVLTSACYIQEPSAMAVVPALNPQPGERVLDLCAAPGSKATDIARRMQGQGVFVANEPHPARVRTLVENLERCGTPACVTQAYPEQLAAAIGSYFDAILVDAPCSGEGMFRKDPEARAEWRENSPIQCAARQREILSAAFSMLQPGGRLVYSTCTFNPMENEQMVAWVLEHFPVSLEPLPLWPGWDVGRSDWLDGQVSSFVREEISKTRRLWPHKGIGEGHFIARFRFHDKVQPAPDSLQPSLRVSGRRLSGRRGRPLPQREPSVAAWQDELGDWLNAEGVPESWRHPYVLRDQMYALMDKALVDRLQAVAIRIARPGLWLASCERNRIHPQHALAMASIPHLARHAVALEEADAIRYLRGESLPDAGLRGWGLIHIDGWPLGWGKGVPGRTNNLYPKGLRRTDLEPYVTPNH